MITVPEITVPVVSAALPFIDPDTALTMRADALIYQHIAHGAYLVPQASGALSRTVFVDGGLNARELEVIAGLENALSEDLTLRRRVLGRLRELHKL